MPMLEQHEVAGYLLKRRLVGRRSLVAGSLRISDASSRNRNVRVSGGAAGRELSRQAGDRRRQRAHARQRGGAVPAPVGGPRGAARLRPTAARLRPGQQRPDPRMDRARRGSRAAPRGARRLPAGAGGGARSRAGGAARRRARRAATAPRPAMGPGAAPPAAGGAALLQRGERRARQATAGRRAAVPCDGRAARRLGAAGAGAPRCEVGQLHRPPGAGRPVQQFVI